MTRRKLRKLQERLNTLRRTGGLASSELESLAQALGRERHPRGSEPTWVSTVLPGARPLTIPHHSRDLNRFTAKSILEQLEVDLDDLEAIAPDDEESNE